MGSQVVWAPEEYWAPDLIGLQMITVLCFVVSSESEIYVVFFLFNFSDSVALHYGYGASH